MTTNSIIRILQRCLIGCAACLAFTGCSLDENPRDQIPEEEAYKNATALYQNTVATLYSYIGGSADGQGLQGTCRGVYDLQTFGSDEAMLPTRGVDWYDGGIWQDMYRHSWTAGHDLPKNAWLYLYKVITLCNLSLKQLDAHQDLLSMPELRSYEAEVRALRAIYYWYLLDLFGNIPIITVDDVSINDVHQSKRRQVFSFIIRELTEWYDYIPKGNSARQGDYYGRVTRDVVNFVLAKLMLNAEVYLSDSPSGEPVDGSQLRLAVGNETMNAWEATIYYCDLIADAGYGLEPHYSNNFAIHNENSSENIWCIALDKDLYTNQQQNLFRSYHYRHAAAYGFTGENGSCATRRTLELFGYGTEEEDARFSLNYWSGAVTDLNGNPVTDRVGKQLVYYPWEVELDLSGSAYVETAGARMKKYEIDKNATKDGKLMDNDIVLFRFADVLLMRAEAQLRNGNPQAAQTDYDAVRRRADVPLRPVTLQRLLDERLLELCWEGWRRQDLIRFGQYESLYTGSDKVNEADGHTTLYPIPADVMALNHNLTQNPGY